MTSAVRLSAGDLVELRLADGLGYVLVTCVHPVYPEVVRILGGLRPERPANLEQLASGYGPVALFPIGAALAENRLDGEVVAHIGAGGQQTSFPAFKIPVRDRRGEPIYWWLWDGGAVAPCTDEALLAAAPIRQVLGPTAFRSLFKRV